jgi:hypothetical protein
LLLFCLFRCRLSPETFGHNLVFVHLPTSVLPAGVQSIPRGMMTGEQIHIQVNSWLRYTMTAMTTAAEKHQYGILLRAAIAQSVYRWAMDWTIGVLGFNSWRGLGIFLFTAASRMALGPTQSPIQWVAGALSLGVKRPRREADHSPPSRAEVKECVELYLHSPNTPSWRGAALPLPL